MLTDNHCHVLPGIDDGARDSEMSINMLEIMKAQGVERVVATPHFYAHREKSVEEFLRKRQAAYDKIRDSSPLPVVLGAEVALEHGISEMEDISKLAFEGTNVILLELPYSRFSDWLIEEIDAFTADLGLQVVLAHIHRYVDYYSTKEMERILDLDVIFQMNVGILSSFNGKRMIRRLMKKGVPLVFGSDAHNVAGRRPDWDGSGRRLLKGHNDLSDELLERFSI